MDNLPPSRDFNEMVLSYSMLIFFFGVFLSLFMPLSLFVLGTSNSNSINFLQRYYSNYLPEVLVVVFFTLFNLSVLIGTRCQSSKDEKLTSFRFFLGLCLGQLVAFMTFITTPSYGMVGESLARLFGGFVFFIVGMFVNALYVGVVKLGLSVSISLRKTRSFKPYLLSILCLLILIPIHYSKSVAPNSLREVDRKKQRKDSVNTINARFTNIQNTFQKRVVRNDSISEYSYRVFNRKTGYEGEYLKTINALGKPICLRRKIFKGTTFIAEDTIRIGESKHFASGIEHTSLQTVNYLFRYNQGEVDRKGLISYCHELIYAERLHSEDAKNIMFVAVTISFSDRPEFPLSEDGLNELFGRLAIAARH